MRTFANIFLTFAMASAGLVRAEDPAATPLPVPLTRPEMKQYLEDLKGRKPRIPLPELTDAEIAKLGERGPTYEGRLRYHYMPPGDERGGGGRGAGGIFSREPDPKMSLDYEFKTMLFWIVSRTNNCHY
jgi:hypothetical protein